jgi:hypothetical protein
MREYQPHDADRKVDRDDSVGDSKTEELYVEDATHRASDQIMLIGCDDDCPIGRYFLSSSIPTHLFSYILMIK